LPGPGSKNLFERRFPRNQPTMEHLAKLRPALLIAAIGGFAAVNLPFLYFAVIEREIYREAMANGLALVFVSEAFLLMFLFAFLIAKLGWRRPGWVAFIVLSLLGSLAFSIPLFLFLHAGRASLESPTR